MNWKYNTIVLLGVIEESKNVQSHILSIKHYLQTVDFDEVKIKFQTILIYFSELECEAIPDGPKLGCIRTPNTF